MVRAFKAHYRRRLLSKLAAAQSERAGTLLAEVGAGITVLDALHMAAAAWAKVPLQLIVSGFIQEGLAPGTLASGTQIPKQRLVPLSGGWLLWARPGGS